jgi:tripartite-type tricarboxylate transporter receptor subunit TctC
MHLRIWLGLLAALGVAAAGFPAAAQQWPSRPIHLVIGFGAGGPSDTIARLMAAGMSETLGQQVIVENKPGAGANLAAELVAKAKPDGYTLMIGTVGPLAVNDVLYSNLPFDPAKDFTLISLTAETPLVLGVASNVPAKSLKEFVDYAKANAGKVNYASPGVGVPPHFASEMFRGKAGFTSTHVPYRSGAAVIDALMKNEVQWAFDVPVTMTAQHKAGKLRALATAAKSRWMGLEDVPTFAESGYPDLEILGWFALCGPAGMPDNIVRRLHAEAAKSLTTPDSKQRLTNLGFVARATTPAETVAFVAAERKRWLAVAKDNNIKVE